MNNPLSRWVALLLVSCLAADPITSAAFDQPRFPIRQEVGAHERFDEDALQAKLLAAYTTLENQRRTSWLRRQAGAVLLQWVRDRVQSWPLHVAAANRFLLDFAPVLPILLAVLWQG